MKRYYIALALVTLLLLAAAFSVLLFSRPDFHLIMPILAFYFAVVTGLQHYVVVRSMRKSPRQFVQYFLGSTVVVLLLHMTVLFSMVFFRYLHHPHVAKVFILTFGIGFAVMLVFETTALLMHVKREKKLLKEKQEKH
jgi:hypothetical protein